MDQFSHAEVATVTDWTDLSSPLSAQAPSAIGDFCPECGEATLISDEGCRKCYTCGFSEC